MEKCNFLKILQCPDFENLWGDSWHLFQPKKLDESDGGFCFLRISFSSHVRGLAAHETTWIPARTVGVSNYIQLDAIINPRLVWLDGLDGLETVRTVWKRSDVSGTMPEVSEIQFWSFSFF